MKRPLPNNPMQQPESGNPEGFDRFMQNTEFLKGVLNPHFPEQGTGTHIPVWLSPRLARQILESHGQTGHAIPHPNINLKDLSQ